MIIFLGERPCMYCKVLSIKDSDSHSDSDSELWPFICGMRRRRAKAQCCGYPWLVAVPGQPGDLQHYCSRVVGTGHCFLP